jgi:hypothetical protein
MRLNSEAYLPLYDLRSPLSQFKTNSWREWRIGQPRGLVEGEHRDAFLLGEVSDVGITLDRVGRRVLLKTELRDAPLVPNLRAPSPFTPTSGEFDWPGTIPSRRGSCAEGGRVRGVTCVGGTDLGQLDARVPVQNDEPRVHRAERRVQVLQRLQKERHSVGTVLVEFGVHAEDRVKIFGALFPIDVKSAAHLQD